MGGANLELQNSGYFVARGGGGGVIIYSQKRGGRLEYRNKHRPKAGVNGCRRQSWGRVREGVSPSRKGGLGGLIHNYFCYLDALWCNLRHFEPN